MTRRRVLRACRSPNVPPGGGPPTAGVAGGRVALLLEESGRREPHLVGVGDSALTASMSGPRPRAGVTMLRERTTAPGSGQRTGLTPTLGAADDTTGEGRAAGAF